LHRAYPASVALTGSYKLGEHTFFLVGLGEEFAAEERLHVTRLGFEYGQPLIRHGEVGGQITYLLKWHGYNTWAIGVVINKILLIHKK